MLRPNSGVAALDNKAKKRYNDYVINWEYRMGKRQQRKPYAYLRTARVFIGGGM